MRRFYAAQMDLSLTFLGTGGSVPTARRATACLLLRCGGERILFDCGEGAQRQMQASTGLVALDEIYLTHFHADHYLGLPGLLKTYDLMDRREPLRIVGPPGLQELFKTLARIFGRISYEVELVELGAGEAVPHEGYEIRGFPVEHGIRAYGYAMVEQERPGHFDPERARGLGVAEVRDFGVLQRGGEVQGSAGVVRPEQVMGEARAGRKVVVSGDSRPCETTRLAAHDAQLLVHDASFAAEEAERARETGHATAVEAAELGKEAGAGQVALVHISSRYNVSDVLEEAQAVYPSCFAPRDFDVVEIPFPERGEPKLVSDGAR
jgi:ribonuclease Z